MSEPQRHVVYKQGEDRCHSTTEACGLQTGRGQMSQNHRGMWSTNRERTDVTAPQRHMVYKQGEDRCHSTTEPCGLQTGRGQMSQHHRGMWSTKCPGLHMGPSQSGWLSGSPEPQGKLSLMCPPLPQLKQDLILSPFRIADWASLDCDCHQLWFQQEYCLLSEIILTGLWLLLILCCHFSSNGPFSSLFFPEIS